MPSRAAASAVTCAANGVDLRDPLKPTAPALFHTITLPSLSVSATIVLLNDVLMCAWPMAMFFLTRRLVRPRPACRRGGAISGPPSDAAEPLGREHQARGRTRRRVKKNVPYGIAHIKTSFNNTIVTITDPEGNVVCWESAGSAGFKGSRKSTPFAAQVTADAAARKGMEHGVERVEVHAKGAGSGRDTAIRSLQAAGLQVTTVKDVSPQAHNGCRPKKRRRP